MRVGHAKPGRSARHRTTADRQGARGLCPRAFPREAPYLKAGSAPWGQTPASAGDEVDRDGHALELETLAHLVLDPVGVVARHQPAVVDREAEARRTGRDLRAVQQVQALAVLRRRLAPFAELRVASVQLGRRAPR